MSKTKAQIGYRIPLGEGYRAYVDATYEPFLALARHIYPSSDVLTDHEDIAQLQNLYFLLQDGLLKITEEKLENGASTLFLEIKTRP